MKYIIGSFVALGGVSIIANFLLNNEAKGIDAALDKMLSDPKFRPLLIKWRAQIERAFEIADKEITSKLDQASAQDANPQKDIPKS